MTCKTSAEYKYTVNRLNSVKMPSIVLDRRIFTYIYKVINISVILWFNLDKILDFDRNTLFLLFYFSELLILREKKIRGFSFGPLEYQKKLQIFKKYWKNTIQESCTKKVQFCTRRRKSHFFWLTLYVK